MASDIQISLSPDEIEILIDALEADHEGYMDSAKEARGDDALTFKEAAARIKKLMTKLQALID